MSLERDSYSAVRWTGISYLLRTALQFLQIAALARLLQPADFGLIAIVLALLAILQIFSDAGVNNAIIHFQKISMNELSSLFWLNVVFSFCLALLVYLFSGQIAIWYSQPELQWLITLSSCSLVINAFCQQIRVVAQKEMRFSSLAIVDLSASFIGFLVTVCGAVLGLGVLSIVVGLIAAALTNCGLSWCLLARGWFPSARLRLSEIRKFIRYGAYMVGNNIANSLHSQADIMLGGKAIGPQEMGLYSLPKDVALRVANVVNPIITQVGLPVMAQMQSNTRRLKGAYLKTLHSTSSINFPIYIFLCVFAEDIVNIFLGEKWQASSEVFRILALWGAVRSTGNPVGILAMALGKIDLIFKWNVALAFCIVPVVWVGSHFGVRVLSITVLGIMFLQFFPQWLFLVKPLCGATFREFLVQFRAPMLISILAGMLSLTAVYTVEGHSWRVTFGALCFAVVYLVFSFKFNSEFINSLKQLFLRN